MSLGNHAFSLHYSDNIIQTLSLIHIGHRISLKAKYCEECGTHIENKNNGVMIKSGTHHLKLIVAGVVSLSLIHI